MSLNDKFPGIVEEISGDWERLQQEALGNPKASAYSDAIDTITAGIDSLPLLTDAEKQELRDLIGLI